MKKHDQPEDRPRHILFEEGALCCPKRACSHAPLVVLEQKLLADGARPRLAVVCPICQVGFRLGVAWVEQGVELKFRRGQHVFGDRNPYEEDEGDEEGEDDDEFGLTCTDCWPPHPTSQDCHPPRLIDMSRKCDCDECKKKAKEARRASKKPRRGGKGKKEDERS